MITFTSNTLTACTVSGVTVTLLAAGTCSITASQPGGQAYAAAASVTRNFTVNPEPQTITFSALSDVSFGVAPFTVSATVNSPLTVMFASTTTGVCSVSGDLVTIVAAGQCSITASQPGDANHAAATPVTRTFMVAVGHPAIVSLSPNAGAGTSATFKAVYTDPYGTADLTTLLLQINSAQSSANACYVYYQPQGNHLYLASNAGTAWMTPALTPGVAGAVSNSQCTLNAGSSSVTTAGNLLTLNATLTFSGTFAGPRNVYLYAAGGNGQSSGWVKEGTWVTVSAGAAAIVSLSPNSGTGTSVTFKAVYSDPNGAIDLNEILLQVNATQSGVNACYVYYQPQGNHLYLATNAGAWITPSLTPGVAGTVSNSQCTLNAGSSSVSTAGNELTLNAALTFSSTVRGTQNVYLYAAGFGAKNSGWVKEGSWEPNGSGAPPTIVSLSPNTGTGPTVTFKAVFADPYGAIDLTELLLQINAAQSGANACFVYYQPSGNHLYLATNAGAWITPALTPGVAGTASNSQCTLNAGSSSVSMLGNDLTVNVAVTFSSAFVGAKNVYLYAYGLSGQSTAWIKEGAWTP